MANVTEKLIKDSNKRDSDTTIPRPIDQSATRLNDVRRRPPRPLQAKFGSQRRPRVRCDRLRGQRLAEAFVIAFADEHVLRSDAHVAQ